MNFSETDQIAADNNAKRNDKNNKSPKLWAGNKHRKDTKKKLW